MGHQPSSSVVVPVAGHWPAVFLAVGPAIYFGKNILAKKEYFGKKGIFKLLMNFKITFFGEHIFFLVNLFTTFD